MKYLRTDASIDHRGFNPFRKLAGTKKEKKERFCRRPSCRSEHKVLFGRDIEKSNSKIVQPRVIIHRSLLIQSEACAQERKTGGKVTTFGRRTGRPKHLRRPAFGKLGRRMDPESSSICGLRKRRRAWTV